MDIIGFSGACEEYFLGSRDSAEGYGELFMYEGFRRPLNPKTDLLCVHGVYYVYGIWAYAYILETKVLYLHSESELKQFIADFPSLGYPLLSRKCVMTDTEPFDPVHFRGTFVLGVQDAKLSMPKRGILRIVLARYVDPKDYEKHFKKSLQYDYFDGGQIKNHQISYTKRADVRRKHSFDDGYLTVGLAKEFGPLVSWDGGFVHKNAVMMTSCGVSLYFYVADPPYFADDARTDHVCLDTPEQLAAALIQTYENSLDIEIDDNWYERIEALPQKDYGLPLLDSDQASGCGWVNLCYDCDFDHGPKKVRIDYANGLVDLLNKWDRHKNWGGITITTYMYNDNW